MRKFSLPWQTVGREQVCTTPLNWPTTKTPSLVQELDTYFLHRPKKPIFVTTNYMVPLKGSFNNIIKLADLPNPLWYKNLGILYSG